MDVVLLKAHQSNLGIYSGVVIAKVAYFIGFTTFAVNSVPFGLDQMPDPSGEQITAFIHWCSEIFTIAPPTKL